MPNWVSIQGKWYPGKEFAVNDKMTYEEFKAGKSPVYEGPCRAATRELQESGQEYLGEDYHMNVDLMTRARTLGFKDIDEYLAAFHNYDPKKAKEAGEKVLASQVTDHKAPARKKGIKEVGGGYAAGAVTEYGDFGKPQNAPQIAAQMKD